MPPTNDPELQYSKKLFDLHFAQAEKLADLANKHQVDVTVGTVSVRPAMRQTEIRPLNPIEEVKQALGWLAEPLKAFLEKLAPAQP